jgi:hypothetical protein
LLLPFLARWGWRLGVEAIAEVATDAASVRGALDAHLSRAVALS